MAIFSGAVEKLATPLAARRSIFGKVYWVSPAWRASRSYSTSAWRPPSQATMPRMKRSCSGMAFSRSTMRRDIRRKSPTSVGISTSDTRASRR